MPLPGFQCDREDKSRDAWEMTGSGGGTLAAGVQRD